MTYPAKFGSLPELEKFFTELGGCGISIDSQTVVIRIVKKTSDSSTKSTQETVSYYRHKDRSLTLVSNEPRQEKTRRPQTQKPKSEEQPKKEEKPAETPSEPEVVNVENPVGSK